MYTMNLLTKPAWLVVAAALAMLINGCTTRPSVRHLSPGISGHIYLDNQPARGVPIYLSLKGGDSYCTKASFKTSSGPDGEFHIPSQKQQLSYTPIMTHYFDEWFVCADIKGERQPLYSDNRYGIGGVVGTVNIRCELGAGSNPNRTCRKIF